MAIQDIEMKEITVQVPKWKYDKYINGETINVFATKPIGFLEGLKQKKPLEFSYNIKG